MFNLSLIIHHLIRPHLKGYHFSTMKIKRLLKSIQMFEIQEPTNMLGVLV
jgi:hypothetical protein